MSYLTVWTNSNDADFQGRCQACLWDIATKVANGTAGYPASGQEGVGDEDVVYAYRILRMETVLTLQQLAIQVLRNTDIAADPATALDNDIEYQVNNIWAELRGIS